MPYCPRCGNLVPEDAAVCSNCGYVLHPEKQAASTPSQSIPPSPTTYPPSSDVVRRYGNYGLLCAVLSLFILPEIFGSAAIILGAYAWKKDVSGSNRGLYVVILGIICMLVGIYLTSIIYLGGLIAPPA